MTSSDQDSENLLRLAANEWRNKKQQIIDAWLEQGEPPSLLWYFTTARSPDVTTYFNDDAAQLTPVYSIHYQIRKVRDAAGLRGVEVYMSENRNGVPYGLQRIHTG